MQQQGRPSVKELGTKLKGAKEAIAAGRRVFAEPEKAASDLDELGIGDSKEVWPLILQILEEVKPDNYEGQRPPEKSYEATINGQELFPFCWDSPSMKKRMYIKFALKEGVYYFVSLHESRFGGEQL